MSVLTGFTPVAAAPARVLILGSMPGAASLAAKQYYAHPRNAFWRILGEIAGAHPGLPYDERLTRLQARGIALWDVLRHCERPGSLDADIAPASMVANDFAGLFAVQPGITRVLFNGATAAQCFRRHVLPGLDAALLARLTLVRLPSTSPAHAGMPFDAKLAAWRGALAEA